MSTSGRVPRRKDDPSRADVWARFAAAYVHHHGANGPLVVASAADDLMREYDARFSPDRPEPQDALLQ